MEEENHVEEVVTILKEDYELLKNCVVHFKDKYEYKDAEVEELKKQLTPQDLDEEIKAMRNMIGIQEFEEEHGKDVFEDVMAANGGVN